MDLKNASSKIQNTLKLKVGSLTISEVRAKSLGGPLAQITGSVEDGRDKALVALDLDQEAYDKLAPSFALMAAHKAKPLHDELLEACRALIDAPHQEHFSVRLNDEEDAALERIKAVLAKVPR